MRNKIILLFVIFSMAHMLQAQIGNIGDETIDQVPVDGGISAIALLAAAYGAKRYKDAKDKPE